MREDTAGLLAHHEPESWRFYVYGEGDDGEPLFSFWMNVGPNTGVCIYERNQGHGKWLSTSHTDDEYSGQAPSEELQQCIRGMVVNEPGVSGERVERLDAHERYFLRAVLGTVEQKRHVPDELLRFIEHCVGGKVNLA